MISSFSELIRAVKGGGIKRVAVAFAHDPDVLAAVDTARKEGIAHGILIGPKEKIELSAKMLAIDANEYEIVHEDDESSAAKRAVEIVRNGHADVLMKGLCSTSTILHAVLDKDCGLRDSSLLAHVAVFQVPTYHKLLILSDAAMNIAPDLDSKKEIVRITVRIANNLGIENPKVAVLAAVEKVNDKMPCTVDAAALAKLGEEGFFGRAQVAGPFAVDNAVSKKSCEVKGILSPVGGDADILIAPNIEAGNAIYKTLGFLANARLAGIIVGAKAPIVLTSRSDSDDSKFLSIAFALKVCQ